MIILGIETSCDETAAAVVEDGRHIMSNVVASQVNEHSVYGGIVPEIASRRHVENISQVTEAAITDAGITLSQADAVAVTYTPGLIGALLTGVGFAKGLAYSSKKPLVPVHHLRGHIASLYLGYPSLTPPFICFVVSGGHSHLVEVKSHTEFKVLGRAVDDAAGEAFDKTARALGLGYPGGPAIESAAKTGNRENYSLPVPHTENPLDVSFSGLKTSVISIINRAAANGTELSKSDIAAAFQHRVVEMLADRLIFVAKERGLPAALCGGVAANTALRDRAEQLAEDNNVKLYLSGRGLCGDNAAMIASAGYYELIAGNTAELTLNAYASRDIETG